MPLLMQLMPAFLTGEETAGIFNLIWRGWSGFRLELYGVRNITVSGIDTYQDEENYFSYRRNCHQGLAENPKDFPCQASMIRL